MIDEQKLQWDDATLMAEARRPIEVRGRDRDWRAERRAAHPRPLSAKVVHPRVLVDAPPAAKKGKVGR